ncbi:VOC family protein [Nonomuraea sp. NPDC050663]|uniref:VOC family protein n=1 Tax=Nonomuraea sp. NPDC050663 TaxID=3364370 RepID=UPI0037A1EE1C
MINGAHVILYSRDPDADRAFVRDVLKFQHVDAGGGWLIFKLPPSELAFHPVMDGGETHELTLMCDDIEATLQAIGQDQPIAERDWGRVAAVDLPGGGRLSVYQPLHPTAKDLT